MLIIILSVSTDWLHCRLQFAADAMIYEGETLSGLNADIAATVNSMLCLLNISVNLPTGSKLWSSQFLKIVDQIIQLTNIRCEQFPAEVQCLSHSVIDTLFFVYNYPQDE